MITLTKTLESLAAIAKRSAQETVWGHSFSNADLISSITSKPRAEFRLGLDLFSEIIRPLLSSRTDPSQPCTENHMMISKPISSMWWFRQWHSTQLIPSQNSHESEASWLKQPCELLLPQPSPSLTSQYTELWDMNGRRIVGRDNHHHYQSSCETNHGGQRQEERELRESSWTEPCLEREKLSRLVVTKRKWGTGIYGEPIVWYS